MTTLGEVLEAIWNLPWYKVVIVATVDDFILLVKLWPLWVALVGIAILLVIFRSKG